jgi:GDSL/SGNH-like Acyl-Esterase family found in Pmr5 and Cas1p
VLTKGYQGTGADQSMMEIVSSVVARMKTSVTFLNVTQLSEHRIDGHVSVYTESEGKVLTDEQKVDPEQYVDCIHWCLPGVPDTWNQLLYAYL